MSQVNEALHDLEAGKVAGRIVLEAERPDRGDGDGLSHRRRRHALRQASGPWAGRPWRRRRSPPSRTLACRREEVDGLISGYATTIRT